MLFGSLLGRRVHHLHLKVTITSHEIRNVITRELNGSWLVLPKQTRQILTNLHQLQIHSNTLYVEKVFHSKLDDKCV